MILIPVQARTRSSLVAGIFSAAGAWCGETKRAERYDTFENAALIAYLQRRYAATTPTLGIDGYVMDEFDGHEELRSVVLTIVPDGELPILKWVWYYLRLFMETFPEARWVVPLRDTMHPLIRSHLIKHLPHAHFIDTERLIRFDFDEIRDAVEACGLVWNEQAALDVFDKDLL